MRAFLSGRLTSSNVGTCVLSNQDSNVAPQTLQDAWPVCGTKNFVSVRLYSAPQSHWTIVAIIGICPFGEPVQAGLFAAIKSDTLPGLESSTSLERQRPDVNRFKRSISGAGGVGLLEDSVAKLPNAGRLIFRGKRKQATIADKC